MAPTPSDNSNPAARQRFGRLYDLLLVKLPGFTSLGGHLDVRRLSADMGLSYEAIYKWLRADRLPARQVTRLVDLHGSHLTKEDLIPFVL
jgi:hypothetical protein